MPAKPTTPTPTAQAGDPDSQRNFRFFDNRQKYLLFVNTTSEKLVVANRVSQELPNLHPRPPALRVFDAGVGDGSVLARVMRAMHDRYPTTPFYVVGKEISLEDVRLTMSKLADRFYEHPATVVVLTNLNYADAPWLAVKSIERRFEHDLARDAFAGATTPSSSTARSPSLSLSSPTPGRPVFAEDRQPDLRTPGRSRDLPRRPQVPARADATEARRHDGPATISSSRRSPIAPRASLDFKVKRVIAPLARALGPGGRMIAIQSHGQDPAAEIVQKVWPDDNPFMHDRHMILKAVKQELGPAGRELNFNVYADNRALFRYDMHTAAVEVEGSIGTSTAFAAWNAAVYVSQVEDERLAIAQNDGRYLEATREVLRKHGGPVVLG